MPEPLALHAATAVCATGHGRGAILAALRDGRTGLRPNGWGGAGWIGQVEGVEAHRLPPALAAYDCRNNRLADMALGADGFTAAVAALVRRHGADRVAVVIGTSTSGVLACEEAYAARGPDGALPVRFDYDHTHDMFSAPRYVRTALGLRGPALTVSAACASSARAFADARNLIATGLCDAAVVGGVDSLCQLTLRGFAALGLVSPEPCRPCDAARNGISIGEAAAFALLSRGDGPTRLLGAGGSNDGYHMSAPHPEGAGAAAALRAALADAALPADAIDWVQLHGTATRANDAAEDAAVAAVFGPGQPASSTKGWFGHTLGAAGALGAVVADLALEAALLPGCLGMREKDSAFQADVAAGPRPRPLRRVAVNAFGFGGINCALVLGTA